jgi:hypothetical protein
MILAETPVADSSEFQGNGLTISLDLLCNEPLIVATLFNLGIAQFNLILEFLLGNAHIIQASGHEIEMLQDLVPPVLVCCRTLGHFVEQQLCLFRGLNWSRD